MAAAQIASGSQALRCTCTTAEGYEAVGFVNDPAGGECISLPPPGSAPGTASGSPQNRTDATATFFLDADCEGDTYYTLLPGAGASERLLLRSVVFS
ncbi:hypothetical protein ABTY20_09595 [Streptomyces sp. NPDC126497]|uniref:hypothetical protein n=1 Tax=Streptomyces sp. NPDC126497 TaxID=3155313 RepID=UPI00331C6A5C